jgi:hypothetical protein
MDTRTTSVSYSNSLALEKTRRKNCFSFRFQCVCDQLIWHVVHVLKKHIFVVVENRLQRILSRKNEKKFALYSI